MKRTLTALACALALALVIATANAESIPQYFTGTLSMSCVPMTIDHHDKDRVLWTDVKAKFSNWELTDLAIDHHGVSGKVYSRGDQYYHNPDDLFGRPEGITDATWAMFLRNTKDKRHTMIAGIHDDKFGSWHYVEDHFFSKHQQGKLVDELCHDATFSPSK